MSLTQLGSKTPVPKDPVLAILETFPNPGIDMVTLETTEFTSLCPITGQPDFGSITISYEPNKLCIESKSLKLFLHSFRNYPGFAEQIAVYIAERLQDVLNAYRVYVDFKTSPRGGISITAAASKFSEEDSQ